MKKYQGQLIYSCRDKYGPVEVIEQQQVTRSLHFGNATQQSAMFLYNPIVLIHKYTQAMLTPLCWLDPKNVLALGLGAASMPKFLLHHFKDIHLDAVELRPVVIDVAHEYFSLPRNDSRLQLHTCPANEFIKKTIVSKSYDLVLVDIFITIKDKDINVDIADDLEKIYSMVSMDGCLCINLLGTEFNQYKGLPKLMEVFDNNVYTMPVCESNTILLASRGSVPNEFNQIDFTTLELKYGLPFRQYFDQMK
ncbi:MAG: hypothetical protein OEY89_00460, partial [Gammaproteobacteria bacterium]|nr:hypothetical protein [Gammaproteobacteria bacterium]